MQEVKEYCKLYELNTRIRFSINLFWSPATENEDARPHCLQLSEALRICVP